MNVNLDFLDLPVERIDHPKLSGGYLPTHHCYVGKNLIFLKRRAVQRGFPEIYKKYRGINVGVKFQDHSHNTSHSLNTENSIIQNIAWLKGFAPKVFELFEFTYDYKKYIAQVVENVGRKRTSQLEANGIFDEVHRFLQEKYIESSEIDNFAANFINGKMIDFGHYSFSNKEAYKDNLYDRFVHTACWGNNDHSSSYQDISEVGIVGGRTKSRFEIFGIEDIDLTGKTVLDLGCSGGQGLYWAANRNASRIVGVDIPEIADIVFEMANFNGYFNIETIGCDLSKSDAGDIIREKTGIDKFDVVIMFSINHHVGFHNYMRDLCGDIMFLETNAARDDEEEYYPKMLEKLGFTNFEHMGYVNESGKRELFICR